MDLREYRKAAKQTLSGFAQKTGLSIPYLSRIERGELRASMEAAIRIHRATGGQVTFADLVPDGELEADDAPGLERPAKVV